MSSKDWQPKAACLARLGWKRKQPVFPRIGKVSLGYFQGLET
ncbi:MAG: hypothetical protein NTY53_16570 [Kiritimatiellaeota bacterium]|nr:hypothetical protein [Kiritimatiellota bacterium]